MKKAILIYLFVTVSNTYGQAQSSGSKVVIRVENIGFEEGQVMFALYGDERSFLKDAIRGGIKKIEGPSVEYTFTDLEKGTYAVSIFHDKNSNGKLDTNFIGIPSEPYGFSNNAKGMFGPPSFQDCRFEVQEGQKTILIKL